MATIYQFRSLAHQTGWARTIDTASQRYHHLQRKELADAAKAKAAKEAGAPDSKKDTKDKATPTGPTPEKAPSEKPEASKE